jgi:hypothetical protein
VNARLTKGSDIDAVQLKLLATLLSERPHQHGNLSQRLFAEKLYPRVPSSQSPLQTR